MVVKERVVTFGENGRLNGVASPAENGGRTALLFFNAGIVHRIGAHRLNVKLARAAALAGYPSLRFDLSGLGDSRPAPPGPGFEDQACADIASAIDAACDLFGVSEIAALGMCSGADNAYRAALRDERIRGLILLDPYAYESRGAAIDHVLARAADPSRWRRKLTSVLAGSRRDDAPPEKAGDDGQSRPVPPREEFGADLARLTDRGVSIYILYTNFVARFVNRPRQFAETFSDFDFSGRIDVDVTSDADHTYTWLDSQAALEERMIRWLRRRMPVDAGRAASHG